MGVARVGCCDSEDWLADSLLAHGGQQEMAGESPQVSVLALAYNHSQYLVETLDSIREQTFQDFELIVSDDASTDDSAAMIRDWNSRHQRANHLVFHKQNLGLCPTLNELLSLATGEYLQLIACDDVLLPASLEQRVDLLQSCGAETAAVYSDAVQFDDDGNELPKTFLQRFLKQKPRPSGDLYSQLLLGNFIPGPTVLMKRALVEEIGGFDASLAFEDWDLWQRLTKKHEFSYCDAATVKYRIHSTNLHRTMPNQAQQFYRILAKHRDDFRARLRILRMMVRDREAFGDGTPEVADFLAWANDYADTRWFSKCHFGGGSLSRVAAKNVVETTESLTRPFTSSSREERVRRAA